MNRFVYYMLLTNSVLLIIGLGLTGLALVTKKLGPIPLIVLLVLAGTSLFSWLVAQEDEIRREPKPRLWGKDE